MQTPREIDDEFLAKAGSLLPVFNGQAGLVTGVDPLSNRSLLEALGDDDGRHSSKRFDRPIRRTSTGGVGR